MDKIRRMPKPEFEPPKRRVPYWLYMACVLLVALPWIWFEDADVNFSTTVIGVFGLSNIGNIIARLILNERAISRSLSVMKEPNL